MEYLYIWALSRIFFLRASHFGTTNLSLNHKVLFHILMETSDLWVNTFLHPSLDMSYAIIILLRSYDIVPQGRCEYDVERCHIR
jgi:hypothetical protein